MLTLKCNPLQFEKMACVYEIYNAQGQVIFLWYCKADDVLKFERIKRNPAFQRNQEITVNVVSWHNNIGEAQTAFSNKMQDFQHMPELNKTISFNRYGSIVCNETGQVFRNQAEAATVMGVNQSRLCQHLKRAPGYKTLKGYTFNFTAEKPVNKQPVQAVEFTSKAPV